MLATQLPHCSHRQNPKWLIFSNSKPVKASTPRLRRRWGVYRTTRPSAPMTRLALPLREMQLKLGRCDFLLLGSRAPVGTRPYRLQFRPSPFSCLRAGRGYTRAVLERCLSGTEKRIARVASNLQRATRIRNSILKRCSISNRIGALQAPPIP